MPDVTYKRHDTFPPLTAQLLADGTPINLTTASTVTIILKGKTTLVTGVMSITTASTGSVSYTWATDDLSVTDDYEMEFEIAWSGGKKQTVPNSGYNSLEVVDDLDDA